MDLAEIRTLAYGELRRAAEFGDGYTAEDLAEIIERPAAGVYATLAGLVRAGTVKLDSAGVYTAVEARGSKPESLSVKPSAADFADKSLRLPIVPNRQACSVSPEAKSVRSSLARAEAGAKRAAEIAEAWRLHVAGLRAYLSAIEGGADE
jgi:hypothetical protein